MAKEMLPIVNKPLIQYGVEEAFNAGMDRLGLITGRNKRAIPDHFDISYELEDQIAGTGKEKQLAQIRHLIENVTFSYTRQNHMRGLGHAILCGETLVGNEAFGVVLADDLCVCTQGDGVMAQMVKLYKQFRCSIIAIQEVPKEEAHKYGVIAGTEMKEGLYRVENMVEKPPLGEEPSNLAVIGRYILTPDIFDILRDTPPGKNDEIQLTDALVKQAQDGCVLAYKFKGTRFDCGSIDGFVDATNYVYNELYKAKAE